MCVGRARGFGTSDCQSVRVRRVWVGLLGAGLGAAGQFGLAGVRVRRVCVGRAKGAGSRDDGAGRRRGEALGSQTPVSCLQVSLEVGGQTVLRFALAYGFRNIQGIMTKVSHPLEPMS